MARTESGLWIQSKPSLSCRHYMTGTPLRRQACMYTCPNEMRYTSTLALVYLLVDRPLNRWSHLRVLKPSNFKTLQIQRGGFRTGETSFSTLSRTNLAPEPYLHCTWSASPSEVLQSVLGLMQFKPSFWIVRTNHHMMYQAFELVTALAILGRHDGKPSFIYTCAC